MECCSDCVGAGPLDFGVDDEVSIEGGVVYTSQGCCSDFEAELVGRFGEGVHA